MNKPINDSEILQNVLNATGENAHSLYIKMGYKSPATVYHILNGINSMSLGFKEKLIQSIPVKKSYLDNGEGEIIEKSIEGVLKEKDTTELHLIKGLLYSPKKLYEIKEQMNRIENKLDELLKN